MDLEVLSLLTPINWVPDRVLLADIKAKHIGRPVSFDHITGPGPEDVEAVVGTLEARMGSEIIVSGTTFDYDEIQNLKVWRREVRR